MSDTKMQKMFDKLVRELEKVYGTGMKTNFQLIEIGSHVFPQLGKNVIRNADYNFNQMQNKYGIINTSNGNGIHWCGTYQKSKTIYIFDSFGRPTKTLMSEFYNRATKAGYRIVDTRHQREQKDSQMDCGLRSLSWIIIAGKRGIHEACKI